MLQTPSWHLTTWSFGWYFSFMTRITQFLQNSELFSDLRLGRLVAFIDTVNCTEIWKVHVACTKVYVKVVLKDLLYLPSKKLKGILLIKIKTFMKPIVTSSKNCIYLLLFAGKCKKMAWRNFSQVENFQHKHLLNQTL